MRKIIKHQNRSYRYRSKIPVKSIYWEFHKGDKDPYPSVPHGHSLTGKTLDGKYKLELWTGNIYEESTGKLYCVAKNKDMKRLYNDSDFQQFIDDCRNEYAANNPSIPLSPLKPNSHFDSTKISAIRKFRKYRKKKSPDRYICKIEY